MILITREYEINSRSDGARLIGMLAQAGYDVKMVMPAASPSARIPEKSYYQVWNDGTITRDDVPVDISEVKTAGCAIHGFHDDTTIPPYQTL